MRAFKYTQLALSVASCLWGVNAAWAADRTFDDPTPTGRDYFGSRVAMSGDRVLIAAPGDDTVAQDDGQVHLFDRITGVLLQTFEDPTPENDGFSPTFGRSVALGGDLVAIGDPGQDLGAEYRVGQVHLFDADLGTLICSLDSPVIDSNNYFGTAVAIQGNAVLVGAPGFKNGFKRVGQAYRFAASDCSLQETYDQPLDGGIESHEFGTSLAVDGSLVVIGASSNFSDGPRGQAHLFGIDDGANPLHTWDVPVPNPWGFAQAFFGISVAIDGDTVVVAASTSARDIDPGDAEDLSSVGAVYVFDADTGNLLHTLEDPTPTGRPDYPDDVFGDRFGESVAIDGDNILVGAFGDNTHGRNVGQAHLFDVATGALVQTFDDPSVTEEDSFGINVALQGNTVLIGASGDSTYGTSVGQAHLIAIDSDGDGIPDDQDPAPDDDDADDDGLPDGVDPDTVGDAVDEIPVGGFDNEGDPNGQRAAILAQLDTIEDLIVAGDIEEALTKLGNLRKKVDGCPEFSEPDESADNNDWIIDCDAQREIRELIDLLITNLGG